MSGLLLGFSGKMASGKSTTAKNILANIENTVSTANKENTVSTENTENAENTASNEGSFKVISFADELRKEVSLLLSHAREVNSRSEERSVGKECVSWWTR